MIEGNNYIIDKLAEWETYLESHSLPTWQELPTIDLYMDQVVELLTQYLDFIIINDNGDKVVTASAINNYVRMKIMPAPHKKKYSRAHIAYLIMICTLKQSLNISYVQKMLPLDIKEEELMQLYNDYVKRHKDASVIFIEELRGVTDRILTPKDINSNSMRNLIYSSAIISGYSRLLAEQLVKLQNSTREIGDNHNAEDKK